MVKILELFGEPILNGGQESFAINVVNSLDERKFHFDFLTPYYSNNMEYKNILKSKKGDLYELGMEFKVGGNRINVIKPIQAFLEKKQYDIVHIHSGSTFFLLVASYAAYNVNINKIIVHSHSSGEKETIKHKIIKAISTYAFYKYPNQICACSRQAAEWKFPRKLIDHKLMIIKNGIDIERFKFKIEIRNKVREMLGIDNDTIVLGHVGRFTEEKNQDLLIDIFDVFNRKHSNSKLILIGDGKCKKNIIAKVKLKKMDALVDFIESNSYIAEYMQAFDVFIFPSKYEGLGMVAIEAQCSGLPVVASSAVPEDINVTNNVRFVSDLSDLNMWVEQIESVMVNKRCDNSRYIVDAGFDMKSLTRQMLELYQV